MSTKGSLGNARGKLRNPQAFATFTSASALAGPQVSFQKKSLVRHVAPSGLLTQLSHKMPLPRVGTLCGAIGLNPLSGSLPGWLPQGTDVTSFLPEQGSRPRTRLPTHPRCPSPAGRSPPAHQPCTGASRFRRAAPSRLSGVPS